MVGASLHSNALGRAAGKTLFGMPAAGAVRYTAAGGHGNVAAAAAVPCGRQLVSQASFARPLFGLAAVGHHGQRCRWPPGAGYRCAHSDVKVPNFDDYRRDSTKDIHVRNEDTEVPRKMFSYMTLAAATAVTVYATKCAALQLVGYKGPPFSEEAASVTEINLNLVAEGKNGTFLWRGTPVFVRHRTAKEIQREATVDLNELRDPQHDKDRTQRPEWLIVLAPCTHLGCVPIAFAGDYGGYFCPCHGSHYDGSGRIRRGPAPRNLDIPYYTFKDDQTVVIGKGD